MAMLKSAFSVENVAPKSSEFELIPAGEYLVQIMASEWKTTKSGGQMLVLEMEIVDGPFAGRKVWERLNLENPNPKAVEIAEETLRDICLAQGRIGCDDSEELHFQTILTFIKVEPPKGEYGPSNKPTKYRAPKTAAPARPAQIQRPVAPQLQQAAPVAQAAANAPAAAPWRRAAG